MLEQLQLKSNRGIIRGLDLLFPVFFQARGVLRVNTAAFAQRERCGNGRRGSGGGASPLARRAASGERQNSKIDLLDAQFRFLRKTNAQFNALRPAKSSPFHAEERVRVRVTAPVVERGQSAVNASAPKVAGGKGESKAER